MWGVGGLDLEICLTWYCGSRSDDNFVAGSNVGVGIDAQVVTHARRRVVVVWSEAL